MPSRQIARELGRAYRTVHDSGGSAASAAAAVAAPSGRYLSLAEREEISRGLAGGRSLRAIARAAGPVAVDGVPGGGAQRWPAAVSGGAGGGRWPGRVAAAEDREAGGEPRLRAVVEGKLGLQLVAAADRGVAAPASFPGRPEMRVSHETIYKSLFVQARGALRKELAGYLRRGRTQRRSRRRTEHSGQGRLREMCTSATGPRRRPTGPCPGTGRVT